MTVPKGFAGIGDWLGPMLGPAFRPELYLAFLMFGPALTYTPLLLTWVAAGLMGGFFSRGVWRSLAAGTLSTITIILVMVGNGLIIIASLGGLGNITGGFSGLNIPPPPPGLTLAEIVNAPLVGQVIQAVASGGPVNPISIVEILLVNFLVNRVIHAVSFIASGVLFSKISQRQHQPVRVAHPVYAPAPVPNPVPAPTPQVQKGPEPQTPAPTPNPTLEVKKDKEREDPSPGPSAGKVAVVLFILALSSSALLVPVSPTHIFQASPSSGQPTGEQLAVNLQKDGTLRMSYSTNLTSLPGVPSDYSRQEFQGLAGAFIFAFNGSVDLGQNGSGSGGGSLSTIASLLPPNGFLAVYTVTEQATGKVRADVLASEFQQGFAVTLTPAVSMMLPSLV